LVSLNTTETTKKISSLFLCRPDCFDEETRIRKCTEEFRAKLEELNNRVASEIQNSMNSAIENCLAGQQTVYSIEMLIIFSLLGVRYERIQCDGPLVKEISKRYPLFQTYFTKTGTENFQLKQIEKMMYEDAGKFFMAHNGTLKKYNTFLSL
jgi:glycogen debranching enzyme